jgi:general secretion pathway protein H
MRRDDGFTLAELLVVLAIMALVALAVWPGSIGTQRADVVAAETAILKAMRTAQALAIGQNRDIRVVIDLNRMSVNNMALPSRISLSVLFTGPSPLEDVAVFHFYPDGTSTGGEVVIRAVSERRVISVNWLTGSARSVMRP